ncbi:MAG: potassium-transporting ATPase subunit KdpA [Thermaerobacter sp.]|nr:potassium-transporting ATPase subunit KdpA [Thermaerobacter sp.]
MTIRGLLGDALFLAVLTAVAVPVGTYIYRVMEGQRTLLDRLLDPFDRLIYRVAGIDPERGMDWRGYAIAFLLSNLVMAIVVYLVLVFQTSLPLNPARIGPIAPTTIFNTVVSFISNCDWQVYSGETALSYLSQWALQFLQFTSPASGLLVAIAFARSFTPGRTDLGNFYRDFVRSLTRIFFPIALLFAIALLATGVPDTLGGAVTAHTLSGGVQTISRGPVAAFEAIKQLGTNGGGFFNANSAHPFENPTPISNLIEEFLMALLPTALLFTFGNYIKNRKQAWVLYGVTMGLMVVLLLVLYSAEAGGNPILQHLLKVSGANWIGKETRFGIAGTSLFATLTTAYTTGAVNAMHDSLLPLGGIVPLFQMMLNAVFGGVGAGLLNILMFVILAVFVTGLMVGRTPELFGKKIEAREVKAAAAAMLIHPLIILWPSAIALASAAGLAGIFNPGLHGLSEVVYAYTSAAANNGSAFAGLGASSPFYAITTGIVILLGRYPSMLLMLYIAGSLAGKKTVPASPGTLRTDTWTFGVVYMGVLLIVGALTFFPALALGPIAEQLAMLAGKVF